MKDFTRQETLALTEATSSQLSYLDKTGLVVPKKYGNSKKPVVVYTWEQVLEIRLIGYIREKVSLQTLKQIIYLVDKTNFDDEIKNKYLYVIGDNAYWVNHDYSNISNIMYLADKQNKGIRQFVFIVIPQLTNIITDVWDVAVKSKIVDFESFKLRAKVKPDKTN